MSNQEEFYFKFELEILLLLGTINFYFFFAGKKNVLFYFAINCVSFAWLLFLEVLTMDCCTYSVQTKESLVEV